MDEPDAVRDPRRKQDADESVVATGATEVFISYSSVDRDLARAMANALRIEGFTIWYDQRLVPASTWDREIERQIADASIVVTLWTPNSVASQWVRTEADYAYKHSKLLPVLSQACEMPLAYRLVHAVDLRGAGSNPAGHANWTAFVQRARELVAANNLASREERRIAEIERERRARHARRSRTITQIILGASLAALAVFAYFRLVDPTHPRQSAVVGAEGSALSIGDLTAQLIATLPRAIAPPGGGNVTAMPMAFSLDGSEFALAGGGNIEVYKRDSGNAWAWTTPQVRTGPPCSQADEGSDGCDIADILYYGAARYGASLPMAVTRDGRVPVFDRDGTQPSYQCPVEGVEPEACHVAWILPSPAGDTRLLVALADGRAYDVDLSVGHSTYSELAEGNLHPPQRDASAAALLISFPGAAHITDMAYADIGRGAVAWDNGSVAIFWHGPDNSSVRRVTPLPTTSGQACSNPNVAISQDFRNLFILCTQDVQVWSRTGGKNDWSFDHRLTVSLPPDAGPTDGFSARCLHLSVSADGRVLLCRSTIDSGSFALDAENGVATPIYDAADARLVNLRGRNAVLAIAADRSGSIPNRVEIVDPADGRELAHIVLPGGGIDGGVVGEDGSALYAAVANDDGVDIWRLTSPSGPLTELSPAIAGQ